MKMFIFILFCTISSSALDARIAVVYHSGSGHTEVIAKAVYEGTLEINHFHLRDESLIFATRSRLSS